jgi:glycyl-tRNA synthetase beta chain
VPDLLIEIGTEEIPASYIEPALAAIAESLREECAQARLALPEPTRWATPRRLVLHYEGVPAGAESVEEMRRGPPVSAGYDQEGNPTKAAAGFARGPGVPVEELVVLDTEKGRYLAARVNLVGESTSAILESALPRALRAAAFPKAMRWTGSDLPFARPIRGLTVLLGDAVVPVRAAGVQADRAVRGHPFLSAGVVSLRDADLGAYREVLREAKVLVDPAERRSRIVDGLTERIGRGRAETAHPGLLAEVTYLTEWPSVLEGAIAEEYLELPVEVLEVAMRAHLRFFPVLDESGRPEPRFLSVTNRDPGSADTVREGNERVLYSRLSDARFFFAEDRKRRLADRVPELGDKALHRDLGSYLDKAERLSTLAAWLLRQTGADDLVPLGERAGLLAKADLVTEMVGEFPELQGTVGRIYAAGDGEDPSVAEAIEDHYRPRGPQDELPRGPVSCAVALAEKIDNLAGFMAVGGAPSGSSDPFGLRRQALGLIRIARERGLSFSLGRCLDEALALLGTKEPGTIRSTVLAFVRDRLYQFALDLGYRYDLVRAALSAGYDDILDLLARLEALSVLSEGPGWERLVEVVERTSNILRGAEPGTEVDEDLLREPEERGLWNVLTDGEPAVSALLDAGDYVTAAREFAERFSSAVHEFFDRVYVNVEEADVRRNRLNLLRQVNRLFADRIADLSDVDRGTPGG